ncbi:Hypothetical Protein FCC1311_086512 [Hondaea fermentalgiana]|uniref:Uncharacterized protein n=1 Tax=Hondaea fermentalgiana TaxID=2315210 RepID=A0A2R5GNG0_9STRA|nr:Hypothetical Protein FCC1311_086512 [Hondaea fermentalgiana]|eukprot:GBG32426.1 Hypothetical Protein FCC1311_086512 [Hondaea fermentalgiana]
MSGSSWTPSTWADVAAVGTVCRTGAESEELSSARGFVETLSAQHGEQEMRKEVEAAAKKVLGSLGHLALCDVAKLSKPSDVLMAAVHIIVLGSAEALRVDMKPSGTAHDDEDDEDDEDNDEDDAPKNGNSAWSSDANWPEVFPDGWLVDRPRSYSIRYNLSSSEAARQAKLEGKTFVLKGVLMSGSSLLVSAMLEGTGVDADPVSAALRVSDFVAGAGRSAVDAAREDGRLGLCGLITAASALQLGEVVRSEVLRPLLGKLIPAEDAYVSTESQESNRDNGERGSGRARADLRVPLQGRDPRRSGGFGMRGGRELVPPGPMGGPGGFGDDLLPGGGLGQGGMLFGPGNAAFDGRFGPGGGFGGPGPDYDDDDGMGGFPPGVPPGARFDPFGPPGIGGPGGGGRGPGPFGPGGSRSSRSSHSSRGSRASGSRGGPGRTTFPGEPDPDHMRPPFGSDDMFS